VWILPGEGQKYKGLSTALRSGRDDVHFLSPQIHVISTEGGAFAAAVERPLYFF
jgi:hypothetical protein